MSDEDREKSGDMNGKVENYELPGGVDKSGVEKVNGNGEHLVDRCAERVVFSKHLLSTQTDPQVHVEENG